MSFRLNYIFLFIVIVVSFISCRKEEFSIPRYEISYDSYPETKLDVYSNDYSQHTLKPVVIYIHGGGWCGGDKMEWSNSQTQCFVDSGYICVSVNYRLSPSVVHPIHIKDVSSAIAWVQCNIEKYGGNPSKLILVGHSAGAHIVALAITNMKYLIDAGVNINNIRVACILDSGPYLVMNELVYDDTVILNMIYKAIGTQDENSNSWYSFSPYNFIKDNEYQNIPSICVVHSDNPLRYKANVLFCKKLREFGWDYNEFILKGYSHYDVLKHFPKYESVNILDIINFKL